MAQLFDIQRRLLTVPRNPQSILNDAWY